MKMNEAIEVQAAAESGFRGRKPGGTKAKNPKAVMEKAKQNWGDDPDFTLELAREVKSECPHMKAMTFEKMTPTQQRNVAGRMHSKAQTRMRANRLKARKMKGNYSYAPPIKNEV